MIFSWLRLLISSSLWRQILATLFLILIAGLSCLSPIGAPPALAALDDDRFDGNSFVLYAGNASLVPPRVTLAESFQQGKPALLVFYLDDSRDFKQYAIVVSRLQAFYERAADFIPVNVDVISQRSSYAPTEPGYYYSGFVPQTVLLDQSGKVVLNEKGKMAFEQVDDVFREVFNLLPRSQSIELKPRPVNEFNTELVQP